MSIGDGANYAPSGESRPVVAAGEFNFAAAFLDHGHINGMVQGLLEAGGTLTGVYDTDPARLQAFTDRFGAVTVFESYPALLDDPAIQLVAAATIPNQRADVGIQAMRAGKHYFTDKTPMTTLAQLTEVQAAVRETSKRFFVYFAERLHNEAAWHAGELIAEGAIGRVLQVLNLGPHRLSAASRPDWFFDKAQYGGIITDIGSHQVEQFLTYAGCGDAEVNFARVNNFNNAEHPQLEDFGEFSLRGDNGASFYSRVDWFTPQGMPVWGDGRTFILGTNGTLELRKYVDLDRQAPASLILAADQSAVQSIDCLNRVGFPFFGQMILDVLESTERAMTQAHIFKATELSLRAQQVAEQK